MNDYRIRFGTDIRAYGDVVVSAPNPAAAVKLLDNTLHRQELEWTYDDTNVEEPLDLCIMEVRNVATKEEHDEFQGETIGKYRVGADDPDLLRVLDTLAVMISNDTPGLTDPELLQSVERLRATTTNWTHTPEKLVLKPVPTQLRIFLPNVAPHDSAGMAERLRQLADQMDDADTFGDTEAQDGSIGIIGRERPIDGWLELADEDGQFDD